MMLKGKQLWFLDKFGRMLPDGIFLRWKYRLLIGKKLHLKHPALYNEKLQYMKLHDRNPLYTILADKASVKAYVASRVGQEYVIPTLGVWKTVSEIDFESLPDSFVLKCTHDSGSTVLCRNKDDFDKHAVCQKLGNALSKNYYFNDREWVYKNIRPAVIAEKYMGGDIADYKFFCFDGKPMIMFIATDRSDPAKETKFDFFDMDFNHITVRNGHPNAALPPEKPSSWEDMKKLASRLSHGLPHVRVDLYEIDGRLYFGEYTFYHWGGFVPFEPEDLNIRMGTWM